jgi:hypothetical protein
MRWLSLGRATQDACWVGLDPTLGQRRRLPLRPRKEAWVIAPRRYRPGTTAAFSERVASAWLGSASSWRPVTMLAGARPAPARLALRPEAEAVQNLTRVALIPSSGTDVEGAPRSRNRCGSSSRPRPRDRRRCTPSQTEVQHRALAEAGRVATVIPSCASRCATPINHGVLPGGEYEGLCTEREALAFVTGGAPRPHRRVPC